MAERADEGAPPVSGHDAERASSLAAPYTNGVGEGGGGEGERGGEREGRGKGRGGEGRARGGDGGKGTQAKQNGPFPYNHTQAGCYNLPHK